MKTVRLLILVPGALASALALSGCATAKLTPAEAHQLAVDFHDAGCGGRFDLDAGAAGGQMGGEAHLTLGLHGECPASTIPPVVKPLPAPAAAGAQAAGVTTSPGF